MTLEQIELHNFGPFFGRHRLDLGKVRPEKSVILIGGLNGAGKTSLLEALQIALYGKMSLSARLSTASYDDFLRQWINRRVRPSDGAAVALTFRAWLDGAERRIQVRRSWSARGERVPEQVDVLVDDELDRLLSDAWSDQVDRFIPARLSQFFFFDGERIEALADPDLSRETLENAVRSLLGLDLVEQLRQDLLVLERRKSASRKGAEGRSRVAELESRLAFMVERVREKSDETAHKRLLRDRAAKRHAEVRQQLERAGGDFAQRKSEIEKNKDRLRRAVVESKSRLIDCAAGALPLTLIAGQLARVAEQAKAEDESGRAQVIASEMEVRDKDLVSLLLEHAIPKKVLRAIDGHLKADRKRRLERAAIEQYLELSPAAVMKLLHTVEQQVPSALAHAQELLAAHAGLEKEEDEIDRSLAAVPDDGALGDLVQQERVAGEDLEAARLALTEAETEQRAAELARDAVEHELTKVVEGESEDRLADSDVDRYLRHSARVRTTMGRFKDAVVQHHVERLSDLILECYLQLLRKKGLVSKIEIDPATCELRLFDAAGDRIPPSRMSAGERQLLAVSMLWGLGKASGVSLPVVIDTPLGRLDGTHRRLLVDRYFGSASHQVVLLSTDEEIDRRYHSRLEGSIAESYTIRFDEAERSSVIDQGYLLLEGAAVEH